jgi:hypothetical protein
MNPGDTSRRVRGDAGFAGGAEVLPFAVLTFVVGTLMVANGWAVVDAKMGATAAAREATRAYVEAGDQHAGAAQATAAARATVEGHGRDADHVRLRIDHADGRTWGRCTRVVTTVTVPVPAVTLPWIGGFAHSFDVVASHSEIIDPYRAGLPGPAAC